MNPPVWVVAGGTRSVREFPRVLANNTNIPHEFGKLSELAGRGAIDASPDVSFGSIGKVKPVRVHLLPVPAVPRGGFTVFENQS